MPKDKFFSVSKAKQKLYTAKPFFGKEEEAAVLQVLRSGGISQGDIVVDFENNFAKFLGAKYAVAVTNGTVALQLALLALGIGKGDEVITTPFSFIASANAILYTSAKPVFVDIDNFSYNIDPQKIEEKITKHTKVIIPVHLFGYPANMPEIKKIAKKHELLIIEDASQAHGAIINRKNVGTFGSLATFSFYATKNMTTGEGGIITTNSISLAKKLRLLRNHGSSRSYHHDILGYNFRMTNLAAAIGREQLKKLSDFNKKRRENALLLSKELKNIPGIDVPIEKAGFKHVFHQFTITVQKPYPLSRNQLKKKLEKANIYAGVYYPVPIHKQKLYKKLGYYDRLPIAEKVAKHVLSLPVHPGITKTDIFRIANVIKNV